MTDKRTVDRDRRRFLLAAATVAGAGGLAAVSIPFIQSMNPSAAARAAGSAVDADISKLEPGEMITVSWRGRPVWILRRTAEQLAGLREAGLRERLRDPDSREPQQFSEAVANDWRSLKPEYLVVVGICTHLGCVPVYRPDVAPADLGRDWPGGFYCPCHGSRYDLAGRVYKHMPAPLNLPVPPYRYTAPTVVRVGEAKKGEDTNWSPKAW